MASSRISRVRDWIAGRALTSIGDSEFEAIQHDLSIPESALRKLLRQTGVEMAPLVEGVRQETVEHLARTLIALQHLYETSDHDCRSRCRQLVITAKDHARLASRSKPEKAGMVEWMLVWLENPAVFEAWLRVRNRAAL